MSRKQSYQPVNLSIEESNYSKDIQEILKDIENTNKQENDIWQKYISKEYNSDFGDHLKEYKIGPLEYTILHIAAKNLRKKFCNFMIEEAKIDPDARSKDKSTPLHILVKSNIFSKVDYTNVGLQEKRNSFKATLDLLIEKKCDVNAQDELGYSALHHAVLKNNYGAVALLLEISKLKINLPDKKGSAPIHLACKLGFEDILDLFINKMDAEMLLIADGSKMTILHLLCQDKVEKVTLVGKILSKLKTVSAKVKQVPSYLDRALSAQDINKQYFLHVAIESNHLNIVETLFRNYNVSIESQEGLTGNLPIHVAAKNGSIEMLDLLKKYYAVSFKSNLNKENALHIAAYNNKYAFIKEILAYENSLLHANKHLKENLDEKGNYIPCIRQRDKNFYTPLLTAMAAGNQKCVEELLSDRNSDINVKDKDGNSVLNFCLLFNNTECLKYLFQINLSMDVIFSKNNQDETILHNACKNGNLEIVRLVLNKLVEDTTNSADAFFIFKNKEDQTCFHIACSKGYLNIIEYLLNEKKLASFLEIQDINGNTGLHLATINGHSSIVTLLIDHGSDVNIKNNENVTAFDVSCGKGYLEISKNILSSYETFDNIDYQSNLPLHVACQEGASEIVKLLLQKGIKIDAVDKDGKNCLDIAIEYERREVIIALLNDENWHKLVNISNEKKDREEEITVVTHVLLDSKQKGTDPDKRRKKEKNIDNPQLLALYEHKMWDILKIILDKCLNEAENTMDFTKIDPPMKEVSVHPLMLIALSGQDNLLQHEVVSVLLDLKWRIIPRCAYYSNLLLYLLFMTLFSLYSIELSTSVNNAIYDYPLYNSGENLMNASMSGRATLRYFLFTDEDFMRFAERKVYGYHVFLVILIIFQIIKELVQVVYLDGFSYFSSIQNLLEIFTYVSALISLHSNTYYLQSAYGSITVLCSFIAFPLFIQKVKVFGVYVVAFKRTLANSAKFFPVFVIFFVGFILSFKIRSNFDVSYSTNSTSYSIIRTLTMVMGELDTPNMGLHSNSAPNYFLYLMFLGVMSTIVLNLFVGIAVGEIKTVLDEADIQQISMRIIFVLKVQAALYPLMNTKFKPLINMNYTIYHLDSTNKFLILKDKLLAKAMELFSSKEPTINISDPQKRLEDSFKDMERQSTEQMKGLKFGFSNQISESESRLFNSQRRIQDSLIESVTKTFEKLNEIREHNDKLNKDIKSRIIDTQKQIEDAILKFSSKTNDEFKHTNDFFNIHMNDTEAKIISLNNRIQDILIETAERTNAHFQSIKEFSDSQNQNLCVNINSMNKNIQDFIGTTNQQTKSEIEKVEQNLNGKIAELDERLKTYDEKVTKKLEAAGPDGEQDLKFKIIRDNLSNQLSMSLRPIADGNKRFNDLLTELNIGLNNEIRSIKTTTNSLSTKMSNLEGQLNKVIEVVTLLRTKFEK